MSLFSPRIASVNSKQQSETNIVDHIKWTQLHGASRSLALINAAKSHQGPLVVVTQDTSQALLLEKEMQFFSGNDDILIQIFPDWETLPYDAFSPHQDIVSKRLETLYLLSKKQAGIFLIPINTFLQRQAPVEYVGQHLLYLKKGQELDALAFRRNLEKAGYLHVSQVMSHSEFSVRGSIIDLYPMGSDHPFRIDLFDDEIDSIRDFDPSSQRSLDEIKEIRLLPAREFPTDKDAITRFRSQFLDTFPNANNADHESVFYQVSKGTMPGGIEYYLPLFFEQTATIFDYLHDESLLVIDERIQDACDGFWRDLRNRYEQYQFNLARPLLSPELLYQSTQDMMSALKAWPSMQLTTKTGSATKGFANFKCEAIDDIAIDLTQSNPYHSVQQAVESAKKSKMPVVFIAESQGHKEALLDILAKASIKAIEQSVFEQQSVITTAISILVAGLEDSFICRDKANPMLVITEKQSKLYVPVSSLHLISRYSGGDPDHAPLHHLGNDTWSKAKKKAAEKVRDVAAQLLDIYAKRAAKPGFAYPIDWDEYQTFADSFPFTETLDQERAINAVLQDMGSANAMDRLVCGDVGFGKTEVAMRAAFIAAAHGKQVAILVPTTLLAQQHYENFKNRFSQFPFTINVISRFVSKKDQKLTIESIAEGKADIIVGTHKLLQDDIQFKDLGLVIIDEEHRFGVRQKEKFKALRADVDILTLTATPIPRTLNMALSGMRDLSIIATPPAKRLPVKTFIQKRHDEVIREAIMREILRGGQVYFLHNEVKTIEKTASEIEEIVPEARVAVGHGQMRERELESVMNDFYHQRYNVLVCSTIIETGIDVASANTIIMDRADHLGLAQLHQLRGRVGRSHHQAYAYLLTPHRKLMTKDATKRLEAIASLEDLGAGFALATHDLEIRGAGELLGDDQSGQINAIGFNLYMEMLEKAVEAMKEGKEPSLTDSLGKQTEIELRIPALIPEDYIGDVNTRLSLYKKLASCKNQDDIDEYQIELIDRFGLLPDATKNLVRIAYMKLLASQIGISKIEFTEVGGSIEFEQDTRIDPGYLIQLIQSKPKEYRFDGPQKLRVMKKTSANKERIELVHSLLESFVKECHV